MHGWSNLNAICNPGPFEHKAALKVFLRWRALALLLVNISILYSSYSLAREVSEI
jgi:hypothetical protein